jgi:hypothetical protein
MKEGEIIRLPGKWGWGGGRTGEGRARAAAALRCAA